MADRYYIGMLDGNASLQANLKPYAIPDNAFAELTNAYVFRGRVRKRFGSEYLRGTTASISGFEQIQSRFKINIGTTDGSGNFPATAIPGASSDYARLGKAFSVAGNMFTVWQTGTPASMYTTGAATGTYNTSNGQVTITGATAATPVYYFPSLPVMGLVPWKKNSVTYEDVIGFDTQFAYYFGANGWERLTSGSTNGIWTGNNSQYFWSSMGLGTSVANQHPFVTNFNWSPTMIGGPNDPIRYWNGTAWVDFSPGYDPDTAANKILTSRLIVFFQGRLILLNVVLTDGTTNTAYPNYAWYSQNGSPTATEAFYPIDGRGGFVFAATSEAIVSAQFLRNRLIVYFESSTYELVYTNFQQQPFVWQKINTELGVESTFSQVPFDKMVIGVGNVGIHACNGVNVERIDNKIPDEVFEFHNDNNGVERVCGIRDYFDEMVYWSFPSSTQSANFPFNNRVLVYNYRTGSWAFNDDSITVFGYFQANLSGQASAIKWNELKVAWQDCDFPWNAPQLQSKFKSVIAGNQQGYTFLVDSDLNSNAAALQITNIASGGTVTATITAYHHNLKANSFVRIQRVNGITGLNNLIFKVLSVTDKDNFVIDLRNITITGTYSGGGVIARITPISFKTKQFNFYAESGRNSFINQVDFFVDRTSNGECTVDFLVSSAPKGLLTSAILSGGLVGTSVLSTKAYDEIPFEKEMDRLWHPVYFWADGETVQFSFYLNETQCTTPAIVDSDFELHAMVIHSSPSSSRLQ